MNRALVIGAGFGGIAAALRLRAKGYQVHLVDRCERPGGRAQVFEREGFRHDAGPTVLTAPFLFEELFELFGERLSDHIELMPLKPWYRFEYRDGTRFDYGGSLEETLAEIERINPADVDGYRALLEHSRAIFDVGFKQLSDQPFHQFGTMLRQIPNLARLGAWRTVWQLVCKHLESDHLRQAFSIQPLLVGGNPFDTTSIYALIHFLERAYGVHFARGGTGALVDSLSDLMKRQGISLEPGSTVTGMATRAGRIHEVEIDGQRVEPVDLVVSNADPVHLYRNVLKQSDIKLSARLKTRHADRSMGLFVMYFGTRRQYPDVAHHTIWLGPRYEALLKDIFHNKRLAEDFSIYLHRPTASDPSFAPAGCDSFYALVPVPNGQAGIDWASAGPALKARVIEALDQSILPGLKQNICADFEMTPDDFEHDYLSPDGAGFSIAPHFRQSAWFRFHNRAEGPANLYLVGAGTHPGAGVPGVLSSAKLVDRLIEPYTESLSQPVARAVAS